MSIPRISKALVIVPLALVALVGCAGKTTGVTNLTDTSATLTATGRCDSGEKCRFYWEYWRANQPRSSSTKTVPAGPVNGATGDVNLSTTITGLNPGTTYRWVICGSPNDGGGYGCTGPSGNVGSTTQDPPSDFETFTTLSKATLAEGWNGTSWAAQTTPNPSNASQSSFGGVSCSAATACTAVGSYTSGGAVPLIERWNGSAWTTQSSPTLTGQLAAVSCASATACTAVGGYSNGATLAEQWDGSTWTVKATPSPAGHENTLEGVSCSAATACIAVGSSRDNSTGIYTPLVESWNGTTWSLVTVPVPANPTNPPGAGSQLHGVSCSSATSCFAVGAYTTPGYLDGTLVENLSGTTWTIQATPTPPGGAGAFYGVSCSASTACTAVGSAESGEVFSTLAERWNGSAWTVQTTPNPTGVNAPYLTGVSCASATSCLAVGHALDASNFAKPVAERWNGTSWALQTTPALAGNQSSLVGLSCVSASACTAAGYR